MEQTAFEGRLGGLGVAVVTCHKRVAAQHDLTNGFAIGRHVIAIFIHDTRAPRRLMAATLTGQHLGPNQKIARTIRAWIVHRCRAVAFRQAIKMHQVKTELLEPRQECRCRGSTARANFDARRGRRIHVIEQHIEHHGRTAHMRHLAPGDRLDD